MNTQPTIETYFKRLDAWRHLPAYRLEPRVDVFFSLYLKEALEVYCQGNAPDGILDFILPELPVSKALLYADEGYTGRDSIKVDFLLLSTDLQMAYLVELKTDEKSVRDRQNEDLNICSGLSFQRILEEILLIIPKTGERGKYMHLLKLLECHELMTVPKRVYDLAYADNSRGLSAALQEVSINPRLRQTQVKVVYVRPLANTSCTTISFEMLHQIVARHEDPISQAFAKHLLKWCTIAGTRRPECKREGQEVG